MLEEAAPVNDVHGAIHISATVDLYISSTIYGVAKGIASISVSILSITLCLISLHPLLEEINPCDQLQSNWISFLGRQ